MRCWSHRSQGGWWAERPVPWEALSSCEKLARGSSEGSLGWVRVWQRTLQSSKQASTAVALTMCWGEPRRHVLQKPAESVMLPAVGKRPLELLGGLMSQDAWNEACSQSAVSPRRRIGRPSGLSWWKQLRVVAPNFGLWLCRTLLCICGRCTLSVVTSLDAGWLL